MSATSRELSQPGEIITCLFLGGQSPLYAVKLINSTACILFVINLQVSQTLLNVDISLEDAPIYELYFYYIIYSTLIRYMQRSYTCLTKMAFVSHNFQHQQTATLTVTSNNYTASGITKSIRLMTGIDGEFIT